MTPYDRDEARQRRATRHREAARARRRRAVRTGALVAVAVAVLAGAGIAIATAMRPAPPLARVRASARDLRAVSVMPPVTTATPDPASPATITITAVGDLLFDSGPRRLIGARGGAAPLAKVAPLLASADLTIANLEGPLSNRGTHVGGKPDNLIFEGDPRAVLGLTAAGVDIVSLANNHTMDHGSVALEDTIATLDAAGIRYAGGGMNTSAAWKPAVVEVKGRKVAYIAATQIVPSFFLPSKSRPGVANGKDMKRVIAEIKAARAGADVVIVSFHWGIERDYDANASQKRDARRCIDAGADLVLAHHPHVMQGLEFYKGKLIAYSLGNFVFPYKTVEGRKSMALTFDYGPSGVASVTATPVYLGDHGCPTVQTGARADEILGKLDRACRAFGSKVVVSGGVGRVVPAAKAGP